MDFASLYRSHLERLQAAYANAASEVGFDCVVIHSGAARKQHEFDDQYWPLRPTPAFSHWVPLAEADCALIVGDAAKPVLIRTVVDDFWEKSPPPECDWFWDSFQVIEVGDADEIRDHLPTSKHAFIGEDLGRAASWGLEVGAVNPPALASALDAVRAIKSDYERACIAEANRRASLGHQRLIDAFRAGPCAELDLHLSYLGTTHQDDLDTPYKNIVAINHNAATLHHIAYGRTAPDGDRSLLVDAGATCLGYASDVTRTTVVGDGDAAALFRSLVEHITDLQQSMCARLRPGVSYEALHDAAHERLGEILVELGVGRGSAAALVERGVTRAFLPHGLGHSLGIQVHDVGCRVKAPRPENVFLRTTVDVQAGHVFTIEPGCYFIDGLLAGLRSGEHSDLVDWDVVDVLRPFGGVRIEDNVAVRGDDNDNLTRDNWASGS